MSAISSNMSLGMMSAEQAMSNAGARKLDGDAKDRAEIKQVADQFESLFLNMVLKAMRNTVQKSGLVDGGNAEEIYRSMLDDEYAQQMATQRQTGIANQIESFMLKAQGMETAQAASADLAKGLSTYKQAALQTGPKPATMDIAPALRAKAL